MSLRRIPGPLAAALLLAACAGEPPPAAPPAGAPAFSSFQLLSGGDGVTLPDGSVRHSGYLTYQRP